MKPIRTSHVLVIAAFAALAILVGNSHLGRMTKYDDTTAEASLPPGIDKWTSPGQTVLSSVNWLNDPAPIRFWTLRANCTAHWQTHQGLLPDAWVKTTSRDDQVLVHIPKNAPKGAYELKLLTDNGQGICVIRVL